MPLIATCVGGSAFSAALLWGIYLSGYVRARVVLVQVGASALGVLLACALSFFDYRFLAGLWKLFTPVAVGLVALTYVVGIQRFSYVDDKAWLPLPFTSLTFQPSEILKLAFILTFALHLERVREELGRPGTLFWLLLHGAVPAGMIMLQGDHGTAMVFAAVFCCMIFAAGISLRYVAAAAVALAVVSPAVWLFVLDNDKRNRILTVWGPLNDPTGVGWQQAQGLISIGSGQVWGKGILSGGHHHIPEMHNDFIFAFIGEATGFVGSCLALVFLLALLLLILRVGARAADPLGRHICTGVFGMFMFQMVWVAGMCLSLLPVAGLTLPFLSGGGTSVVLSYAAVGLVLSVHRHSYTRLFDI